MHLQQFLVTFDKERNLFTLKNSFKKQTDSFHFGLLHSLQLNIATFFLLGVNKKNSEKSTSRRRALEEGAKL